MVRHYKLIALILIVSTLAFIHIMRINHKPADIYASQQEVAELRKEVHDLREQLKQETHPARIQRRTMDWILQQGEFEGSAK
ncbi:MAG: hypothetical protein AB9883_07640 [Acidaminococcaceae bacterium]